MNSLSHTIKITRKRFRSGLTQEIFIRVIVSIIALGVLYFLNQINYILYHYLVEFFSVIIAGGTFLIIWNSHKRLDNNYFLIVSVAMIFAAIIDSMHAISYSYPQLFDDIVFSPLNISTQLWLVARYLQSTAFLVAPFFIHKKVVRSKILTFYIILTATLAYTVAVHLFPLTYLNSKPTIFNIVSECIITITLIISVVLLYYKRNEFDRSVYKLLMASIAISSLSELIFVFYSNPFVLANFIGHILKVISYYLFYRTIIVTAIHKPHDLLFRKITSSEREIKIRNKQLEKERNENLAILSSLGDAVVALDNEGRIQFVNKTFTDLTDLDPHKVSGMKLFDLVPLYDYENNIVPENKRPSWIAINKKKHGVTKIRSYYLLNSKKHKVDLSITATPILDNNKVTGCVIILEDISKEKEIERTKMEYLAFVAHQLRTPLSTIGLTAEIISNEVKEKCLSESSEFVSNILKETDRMAKTVDTFLNVTKIEAGLFPINPESQNISKRVRTIITELKPQSKIKKVKIVSKIDPKMPKVAIDFQILDIVLGNLIINAIKYAYEKSTVTVRTITREKNIIFMVKNIGPSIPEDEKLKVFHKMFRGSNTANNQGSGLGLYIVRSIVIQSGGKIWFESENNETVFYVSYPLLGMKKNHIYNFSSNLNVA